MTIDPVAALRLGSGAVWLVVALWFSGSIARAFLPRVFGAQRPYDERWAFSFFLDVHQIGHATRFIFNLTSPLEDGPATISLVWLQVLSIMLASAVFWRRYNVEGWRW